MCSDHFVSGKPSQLYEINHEDWAPFQNLGYNRPSEGSKQSERASRAVVRWSRKRMREELEGENLETTEDQLMETENRRIKDVGTQTTPLRVKATMSTLKHSSRLLYTKFAPW